MAIHQNTINQANLFVDELNRKFQQQEYFFEAVPLRKFIRIEKSYNLSSNNSRSVFCFIDENSNVLKAATWKAPANGIRFSINSVENVDEVVNIADLHGSFLYMR